jgi:hypothetical protein
MFSFDVFSMEGTFFEKTGGFLMHNISTIVLAIALAFAWKKEEMGGYLFIFLGLFSICFFKTYQSLETFLIISLPMILIGILFILNKKHE